MELRRLAPELSDADFERALGPDGATWRPAGNAQECLLAACGVGLARSGARAAALLSRRSERSRVSENGPGNAFLAGLAGTYDAELLPPGSAFLAHRVEVDGLGVGAGSSHVPLGQADGPLGVEASQLLRGPAVPASRDRTAGLLSVASASASPSEARARRLAHPRCAAEDMEAHSVLWAASEVGVRLVIVRGISNVAGDRSHEGWLVDEALAAVRELLVRVLSSPFRD